MTDCLTHLCNAEIEEAVGGLLAQHDTILSVYVTLLAQYTQGRYFSSNHPMHYLLLMIYVLYKTVPLNFSQLETLL